MRLQLLVIAVLASGCLANHAELERQQARLDRDLVMLQARADQLNELRREADQLELELQTGFAEFPELEAELKTAEARPIPGLSPRPPLTLPPSSAFEGVEGARKRAMLTETDARIRMLDRVVAETVRLEHHNRAARRVLESIKRARAARAK